MTFARIFTCVTICMSAVVTLRSHDSELMKYSVERMCVSDNIGVNQYKSMLSKPDGCEITTTSEWNERRSQIKVEWLRTIGPWDDIITGQRLQVIDSTETDNGEIMRYTVTLEWLPGISTVGYMLVPAGLDKPAAAVITFFYEPETAVGLGSAPNRDFALQLARNGLITLSLGSTETTLNKTYGLYYPSIDDAKMESLSAMAYAAANSFEALALDERVDPQRIGVMGHSYGGKWAMFASCLYDKFACAAWGDPGIVFDETKAGNVNYWEPWYLGYRLQPWTDTWKADGYLQAHGAYKLLREGGHDLHELHALMVPRPFLVSGGFADGAERMPALLRTVEVNNRLGFHDRVFFTQRPDHAPTAEANRVIVEFFKHFLICP